MCDIFTLLLFTQLFDYLEELLAPKRLNYTKHQYLKIDWLGNTVFKNQLYLHSAEYITIFNYLNINMLRKLIDWHNIFVEKLEVRFPLSHYHGYGCS
jgi:hypothetical protein